MGAGLLLKARRSDGSVFPVEISLKPLLRDGQVFVVAAIRDVTDRVATEDHLHRVLLTLDASLTVLETEYRGLVERGTRQRR